MNLARVGLATMGIAMLLCSASVVRGDDNARLTEVERSARATADLSTATTASTTDSTFDGAGCYIALPDGVVVVVNRLLHRLQLPIGRRESDEKPRQTAYRETLEETGIAVRVDEKLLQLRASGVHLFSCTPLSEVPTDEYANLQPRDRLEVSEVLVIDPRTMTNYDGRVIDVPWRFPAMRWMVRIWYARYAATHTDGKML